MPLYVATRGVPTRRRQYEIGDTVARSALDPDEWDSATTSGAVVPARFVDTAAALAARNPTPGPGVAVYATDTNALYIGDGVTALSGLTAISGGGGGAVSSVVGQTGAVTGTQILADATVSAALALKAPLASPTLTGTPAAPTAAALTGTTQIATTAYVDTADALNAKKASNLSDLASASTARTNLGLVAIASSGSASDLSAGTVPTARLGSGSASASTVLLGNQTWAAPPVSPAALIYSMTALR